MIVDCHTHVWASVEQLGRGAGLWGRAAQGGGPARAGVAQHLAAARPVDKTFVLAFKSHLLEADVPNDFVADYVRQHPDRLVGFACVDPSRPRAAIGDLREAHGALGMRGVSVWPAVQGFHPAATGSMALYEEASGLGMPMVFHLDVQGSRASRMEYARPFLLDEPAREFPALRMIVAGLGYPWTDETIMLLGKHEHVYAEISGLLRHPWHAYTALLAAYEAGVTGKLLFGSSFPCTSAAECIETLYSLNTLCHGTNLPTIPREQLRQIVERRALDLLGIETGTARAPRELSSTLIESED